MTDKTARIMRCPQCGKSAKATAENPARPFCSRRCKLLDLGEWLDESHSIPGEPAMDEASLDIVSRQID